MKTYDTVSLATMVEMKNPAASLGPAIPRVILGFTDSRTVLGLVEKLKKEHPKVPWAIKENRGLDEQVYNIELAVPGDTPTLLRAAAWINRNLCRAGWEPYDHQIAAPGIVTTFYRKVRRA